MQSKLWVIGIGIFLVVLGSSGCLWKNDYTYDNLIAAYGMKAGDAHGMGESYFSAFSPGRAGAAGKIDLPRAIAIGIRNNPDMVMALSRITRSEAMIEEAKSAFWPVFGFYTEYGEGDAPSAYLFKTIDQRQLPAGVNFNDPGAFRNFESGGVARLNLFRGGRDLLRKGLAEKAHTINKIDLISVKNDLAALIIKSYFTSLAARDLIQIERESVDAVEVQLKTVRVRHQGGSALKSEVLSLAGRLAKARADLIRAENAYRISIAALANLMGMEADADIEIAANGWRPPDLPANYREGLPFALAKRPELMKVRERIISSKMALDLEQRGGLPTLDVQAKGYVDDPDMKYGQDRSNWTAGIVLNWEIFSGFSRKAKIHAAQAVLEEMLVADRKATQSVQLDVKTAYLRRSESEARLEVAKASAIQAEEALRLVRKEYEGGSATIVRYLDAQLAQNTARVSEISAYYDLKKAGADLCRALGCFGEAPNQAAITGDVVR